MGGRSQGSGALTREGRDSQCEGCGRHCAAKGGGYSWLVSQLTIVNITQGHRKRCF